MKYGINDGKLGSDVQVIGSCTGTQSDIYECGGENKYIKWSLDLGNKNFVIKSKFKVEKVAKTALTFVLWSGNNQFRIGLDGDGNKMFYEGGSWGKRATALGNTNLKSNRFQNIVIRRTGNALKIAFSGKEWNALPIDASIDAVGWRPWRNTIRIKNLVKIVPTGNIRLYEVIYCYLLNKFLLQLYSILFAQKKFLSCFSERDCPARTGYNNHLSGGCKGLNELGIHEISRNDCAYRCNQEPTCLSYEYRKKGKALCQLSSSCVYNLTVNDPSDPFCFYEKQGTRLL